MTNPSLPNDFLELSNDASEAATEDSHATENQVSLHSDADPVSDPGSSFSALIQMGRCRRHPVHLHRLPATGLFCLSLRRTRTQGDILASCRVAKQR